MSSHKKSALKAFHKKHAQKRRRYYAWWAVAIVAVIAALTGTLAWGSGHQAVIVQDVHITGNEVIEDADIREVVYTQMEGRYVYLFDKRNILLYPKEQMRTALRTTFPRLQKVRISSDGITKIHIDVSERESTYLWCGDEVPVQNTDMRNACYFMDKSGFIFSKAPHFSGNVYFRWFGSPLEPDVASGAQFIDTDTFTTLTHFIDGVSELGFEPTRLTVGTNTPAYTVAFANDSALLIGEIEDVSFLLDTLQSALSELDRGRPLEYIDLRFGNKVFYKYKDSG